MSGDDPRSELAALVRAVSTYVQWHGDCGTVGFERPVRRTAPREVREVREEPSRPAKEEPTPSAPPPAGARELARPAAPARDAGPSSMSDAPATAAGMAAHRALEVHTTPEARLVRLEQIRETVTTCVRCELAATRKQTVYARGNPAARLCFVGEAPGADEDEQGLPFVGRAGQLLDKMIAAMGLDPERDVYIANIIKCRPPDNRKPTPEEVSACRPYLDEQLDLVKPEVMVALGNTAVAALLGTTLGITKLRGQWKLYRGTIALMPTYHPSYLLRPSRDQADAKRQAWDDLQSVMKHLKLPLPQKKPASG